MHVLEIILPITVQCTTLSVEFESGGDQNHNLETAWAEHDRSSSGVVNCSLGLEG
jgi:hypothetical protein